MLFIYLDLHFNGEEFIFYLTMRVTMKFIIKQAQSC